LAVLVLLFAVLFGASPVWADDDDQPDPPAAADDPPAPADDHPAQPAQADDDGAAGAGTPDGDADNDGKPDSAAGAGMPDGDADNNADNNAEPDAPGDAAHDDKPDTQTDTAATDADHDGKPDDADHDGKPDSQEDSDGDGVSDAQERAEAAADEDADPEDLHYNKFDLDGDGGSDPALEKEWAEATAGFSAKMDEDAIDASLDARPEDAELAPSISAEQFREIVALVKKVVLAKMENKMARSTAKKMAKFSKGIFIFSLLGLGLLLMPLFLRKKYPGKDKLLFKYSALAALLFFVSVNLFGGVLYGMKTVQSAVGSSTNPALAVARGTFDTLHENAEDYLTMGKELFVPTLLAMEGNSDEPPVAIILENGIKVVEGAKVFVSIAKMVKKINFVFGILPIVFFALTMLLFALAVRPTLTEIVKLPMLAASGAAGVGAETTRMVMRRVWGEMRATICTIGVLIALTLLSGFVLAKIVKPALDALLAYFSLAVNYLQFVDKPSSGIVFLTLFSIVLFLALNLGTLILSMTFFLGKCQKIFQARFNDGTPLATHKRFFKWGVPAVVFVQFFPLLFIYVAGKALEKINESLLSGIKDADAVPWSKILLAGPLFLVVAYALMFWGARGIKAIGFLFSYKVKPKALRASAPAQPAEPV
jgi:hypothetical protein